jgi:hypothetical protein
LKGNKNIKSSEEEDEEDDEYQNNNTNKSLKPMMSHQLKAHSNSNLTKPLEEIPPIEEP